MRVEQRRDGACRFANLPLYRGRFDKCCVQFLMLEL
jgi:hypothetical protein